MTKLEFINTLTSNYQCEPLDGIDGEPLDFTEGFQLYIDDVFGFLSVVFNRDDEFSIKITIYDEHHDMHGEILKYQDAFTLAYYKIILDALENTLDNDSKIVSSSGFDADRKFVCCIECFCGTYSLDLISRICISLSNTHHSIEGYRGDIYEHALIETIFNDPDYMELREFQLDINNRAIKSPYAVIFTGDICNVTRVSRIRDRIGKKRKGNEKCQNQNAPVNCIANFSK